MIRIKRDRKLFRRFKQITREYSENFERILATWNAIQLVKGRMDEDKLCPDLRQSFHIKLQKLRNQHTHLVAVEKRLYMQEVAMRAELGMR